MKRIVELPFPGQADRICDIIVENVVEEYLKRDSRSHINIHALGSPGMIMLSGTVNSQADFDLTEIIRKTYSELGYTDTVEPFIHLEPFPAEYERNLEKNNYPETVIVHGFASRETKEFLPRPLILANDYFNKINQLRLADSRFNWLLPDGKITLSFQNNEIEQLIIAVQHTRSIQPGDVKTALIEEVFSNIINQDSGGLLINPAGNFTEGGLQAGSGSSHLNQDAITYGGLFPRNSISFIGKDPRHPAKCGTYFARFLAKELLQKMEVDHVYTRLVYAAGISNPLIMEARLSNGKLLTKKDLTSFDARPSAIMEKWQLQNLPFGQMALHNIFLDKINPLE